MTYQVIVADPPWDFTTWSDKAQKSAKSHYPVMSTQDIMNLPVGSWAADNSILLLWSTWPNLIDALMVGQSWGFEYKTLGFIWIKRSTTGKSLHMGLGYYTRSNSEPCLLFVKGKVKRESMGVHQVIDTSSPQIELPGFEETLASSILAHSTKPEQFYRRTKLLMGSDKTYLELFSRTRRAGWDVMGNEIDGQDIRNVLSNRKESK